MSRSEYIFGNVMLGTIAGLFLWASLGGVFGMMFRDNLFLIGHYGVRAGMYYGADLPY